MNKTYMSLLCLLSICSLTHARSRHFMRTHLHNLEHAIENMIDHINPYHWSNVTGTHDMQITEKDGNLTISFRAHLSEEEQKNIKAFVNMPQRSVEVQTSLGSITILLQQDKNLHESVLVTIRSEEQKERQDLHGSSTQQAISVASTQRSLEGKVLLESKESVSITYNNEENILSVIIPVQMPEKPKDIEDPNRESIPVIIR